jgi:hypothetical protein
MTTFNYERDNSVEDKTLDTTKRHGKPMSLLPKTIFLRAFFLSAVFAPALVFLAPLSALAFTYEICNAGDVTCLIHPIPNPIPTIPAKGVPFNDTDYSTSIIRVTDKVNDNSPNGVKKLNGDDCNILLNPYSTTKIENADSTYLLVSCGEDEQYLYKADTLAYKRRLDLVKPSTGHAPEPRWDPNDPNILYFRKDTQLIRHDVRDDSETLVHDFVNQYPTATFIWTETKGEPSLDGRYWAFEVRGPCCPVNVLDWIVYDKLTDRIVSWKKLRPELTPYGLKFIGMSPKGDYVIMKDTAGPLYSVPYDFSAPRIKIAQDSHADLALDKNRDEVLVSVRDLTGGNGPAFSMYNLRTGVVTDLAKAPSGAFHISGNNYGRPGWALAESYEAIQTTWMDYSLFMIELDPNKCWNCVNMPKVWKFANTYCKDGAGIVIEYWTQAFATISQDGLKVFIGANWFNTSVPIDTYQVTLPATWWTDLGGTPFNQPPLVSLYAKRLPAETFVFTTAAGDPDGRVVSYEWDFDGNQTFTSPSSSSTTTHTYLSAGVHDPVVRVTDTGGATATATYHISMADTTPPSPPTGLLVN